MYYITANPSTAQTNQNVIPAVTDRRIILLGLYVSSDTELTLTLLNSAGHEVLHRFYAAARGGEVLDFASLSGRRSWGLPTAIGEGVDYTTSVDGNVFIGLHYKQSGQ